MNSEVDYESKMYLQFTNELTDPKLHIGFGEKLIDI